jgi:hypothetical protein
MFYATSTWTQKIQRLTKVEIRNNIYDIILADEAPSPTATKVHYDPENSWEDLHCRNPSHLYVGFIQVNRTVRAEFGPLYNFVREFSFPELGYILRQADPEDGQWYDEIIPIFSALGEKLPKAPGLDITPLLCIDWTSDALAWPWTSIFHYNKRDYSLHIRAICRLLRTGNLWCRVYDDFGIVGISIGQRNGWSLVLTLELGEELYGLHDMKKQSEVVADFIR